MNISSDPPTLAESLNAADPSSGGQLAVSKDGIFGPTFQGEGSSIGRRCYFLRLAGCNQHCHWCDTPYTWAFSPKMAQYHDSKQVYDPKDEVWKADAADLFDELTAKEDEPSMLVISGGEPMLQQKRLFPLIDRLKAEGWRIEIETAGTIMPASTFAWSVDQFNVSPKLANSGNPLMLRYKPAVLDALQQTKRTCWKFVATDVGDITEIRLLVDTHGLKPIYIMPEGIDPLSINYTMQELAEAVLAEGWNMTTRLQVSIWGNRRGV